MAWLAIEAFDEVNGCGTLAYDTDEHHVGPSAGRMGRVGRVVELVPRPELNVVVVGRSRGADIVLRSRWVSVVHAFLQLDGSLWSVRDRNSRNGTWLNGVRLARGGSAKLTDGDILSFGGVLAELIDGRTAP